MKIHEYLATVGSRITSAALANVDSAETWRRELPGRRKAFLAMMGLTGFDPAAPRHAPPVVLTAQLERDGYRVERLHFEPMNRLYTAANLYIPRGASPENPCPAVVHLCGHDPRQTAHYQAHLRHFARLGFVALGWDTLQYGEIRGYHHGTYTCGWWNWLSKGYTPGGVELFAAIRAVDLLRSLPFVDPDRIGATGISGGGGVSWYLGAADERVTCIAPVCGTGTVASHIKDRTIDGHCDCMFPINTDCRDMTDLYALAAPRPCLVASTASDILFTIESVRECCDKLQRLYALLGAEERFRFVETPGPHAYHPAARAEIFAWFLKHLAGRDAAAGEAGDIDPENDESDEDLRVFVNGVPRDDITTIVQDRFISAAAPAEIESFEDLAVRKAEVIRRLRETAFRHFPVASPPLDVQSAYHGESPPWTVRRYEFVTEEAWHLELHVATSPAAASPAPAVLAVQQDPFPWVPGGILRGLPDGYLRASVGVRGTGRQGWPPEEAWSLRRSLALIGRTIASLRVWDVLRALEALRQLPGVDGQRIALAGAGELAVVALYAALLDGNVSSVILADPPTTHDAAGPPGGTGPAIELLRCLTVTDLPEAAALLHPSELVFLGPRPAAYDWTEDLLARLGRPARHLDSLAGLAPPGNY